MYRGCFEDFAAECVRRIGAGEPLSEVEACAFGLYLEARERSGRRLLGRFAGADPSIDTASGRCGVRPPFSDLAAGR
jgi:hypothetical protein